MEMLIPSIQKFFTDFGIEIYIYDDTSISTDETITASPSTNLVGTENNFIAVQIADGWGSAEPIIKDDADYLKYRYLRLDSGVDIKIIAYNNFTGRITLESAIGEAVLTTDTFNIAVLDSCFIELSDDIESGMIGRKRKVFNRIYLTLQTKEDSNKNKLYNYMNNFREAILVGKSQIPLYNKALTVIESWSDVKDFISFVKLVNDSKQIQLYRGTFGIEYRYQCT